jgi:hypothetical protein
MLVTFKANTRVLNYMPGKIYTVELTPLLKGLLKEDTHLNLIDPPSLEEKPTRIPTPLDTKSEVSHGSLNKNSNHAKESGSIEGQNN